MKDMEYIGSRIKSARKSAKITQGDLSDRTGLTRAYICRVEKGQAPKLSIRTVMQIADALEVPVYTLVDDERTVAAINAIKAISSSLPKSNTR